MWRAWIRHGGISMLPDSMLPTTLQTKLEEDPFVYECSSPDCCPFHAALGNVAEHFISKYCALCICKRYVYTICSHLTQKISANTKYMPGRHKPMPEGIFKRKFSEDEDNIQHALEMAVLKEYKNPISGVDLPRGGSMNGTTPFLPKDKDPQLEIEEQLKSKVESLQLEGEQNHEKDVANLNMPLETPDVYEASLSKEEATDSVKSNDNSTRTRKTISRRLWARFDQETSAKESKNNGHNSTTFHSYN